MSEAQDASRETVLARTFVQIADTLVRDFDVHDLFDRLTMACVDLLGAATAGLMLADQNGQLQLMASSNEAMRNLELFEMSSGQGPCLECFASGQALTSRLADAEATARWPAFATEARRMGFSDVQALPMRLRGETIGALNVFHTGGATLSSHDVDLAQALADLATIAILQQRALTSSEALAGQLQTALNDRIVIEQVKGLLAERGQIAVDEAFDLLRQYCRSNRLPLTRTARDIVSGTIDPDEVLAGRWPSSIG